MYVYDVSFCSRKTASRNEVKEQNKISTKSQMQINFNSMTCWFEIMTKTYVHRQWNSGQDVIFK